MGGYEHENGGEHGRGPARHYGEHASVPCSPCAQSCGSSPRTSALERSLAVSNVSCIDEKASAHPSCCPNVPCERQNERERTSVPCSLDCWPSSWSFAAVSYNDLRPFLCAARIRQGLGELPPKNAQVRVDARMLLGIRRTIRVQQAELHGLSLTVRMHSR